MEDSMQIDWLIILVAAVLNMIIGALWYSKWLFGETWMKLCKSHGDNMKHHKAAFVYAFIVSLVIAFFLYFFESHFHVTTVSDGMFVGFCAWLGFVATTQASSAIWCQKPIKLFFINTGCKLVSYLVMGGIIGA